MSPLVSGPDGPASSPGEASDRGSPAEALLAYQAQISQNMLNVVIKDMIRELEAVALLLKA